MSHPGISRHEDDVEPIPCPYGDVRRIITGGEQGAPNVHLVRVSQGGRHFHQGYDETYFVIEGEGVITLGQTEHRVRPGSAVFIPAGLEHSVQADAGQVLGFVIFGTPGMLIGDARARPRKAQ